MISISHCRSYATALAVAVRGFGAVSDEIPF
jgi:hypothetical protein